MLFFLGFLLAIIITLLVCGFFTGGRCMAGKGVAAATSQRVECGECDARAASDSSFGIVVSDIDLRIIYINKFIGELFQRGGVSGEEVIGQKIYDVFRGDGDDLQRSLHITLSTGKPQPPSIQSLLMGGETYRLLVNSFPVRDDRGGVVTIATNIFNISDDIVKATLDDVAQILGSAEIFINKEDEQHIVVPLKFRDDAIKIANPGEDVLGFRVGIESIHKSHESQRMSGLGVWERTLHACYGITSLSPREVWGFDTYSPEELFYRLHPDDSDRMLSANQRLLTEGTAYREQYRIVHDDGRVTHAVTAARAVRDDTGAIARIWGVTQDITARIEAEEARHAAIRDVEKAHRDLAAEQASSKMVQQSLLPAGIPTIPDLDIAYAYRPVADSAEIGGDWYDAFLLSDTILAITVGDVAGHDLRAAVTMGNIRSALRAYAVEHHRPGEVLHRCNTLLMALPDPPFVTAFYGIYNCVTHTFTYARAGHQPPLLCHNHHTRELVHPPGIALGVCPTTHPYREATVTLHPGDTLILYTDGLVEHRRHNTQKSISYLIDLVNTLPSTVSSHDLLSIITSAFDIPGAEDDVCIFILHRPPEDC